MEFLQALIDEKWLLSSALVIGLVFINKERLADKNYYRERDRDLVRLIDALTDALQEMTNRLK